MTLPILENSNLRVAVSPSTDTLLTLFRPQGNKSLSIQAPQFHIDGRLTQCGTFASDGASTVLSNGVTEHRFRTTMTSHPEVSLLLRVRIPKISPIVRFNYTLTSTKPVKMTKPDGKDSLRYATVALGGFSEVTEVRLSEFNYTLHMYHLTERAVTQATFDSGMGIMGPILAATDGRESVVLAYEHGSPAPDAFVQFSLNPSRTISIDAVKGNYYAGRVIGPNRPYESIWLQAGLVKGCDKALARTYREFVRTEFAPSTASRRPHLYTNTWGFQTKEDHSGKPYDFNGKMIPPILTQQIDVAKQLGITVFVLDTGWYEKTGDYRISPDRLAAGFPALREQMRKNGIQLGLWFEPTSAAVSSDVFKKHPHFKICHKDQLPPDRPVWGTENSHDMCLSSGYADVFADRLIELVKETGVTYFKWDGMNQWYFCDADCHDHGTAENSLEERKQCFLFEYNQAMTRIVEKVITACPDLIVDFDITEHLRNVGLSFLSVGKYFIMNDGTLGHVGNIGRSTLSRYPIDYDKWIPSSLFLSHFLPPSPVQPQDINLASMMLGFNGLWGDTVAMSADERKVMSTFTAAYHQISDDFTAASPVRNGNVGDTPEIHEKIHTNGRGAVVVFGSRGHYSYVTKNAVDPQWITAFGATGVTRDTQGRAHIEIEIQHEKFGAGVVFFGAKG